MPIPDFDATGLLPSGIHDCTIPEINSMFGWNNHRRNLLTMFMDCFFSEIRPKFSDPLFFNGSFVTDKEKPEDIDIVLDLRSAPDDTKGQGLLFMYQNQKRLMDRYRVHFWVNLPGRYDFSIFFQYVGVKTAKFKGLPPEHYKGILRLI